MTAEAIRAAVKEATDKLDGLKTTLERLESELTDVKEAIDDARDSVQSILDELDDEEAADSE